MKNIALSRFCGSALVLLMMACVAFAAVAQVPVAPKPAMPAGETPAASGVHELTAADVEVFLEGFLPAQIERDDIAGAVVVIVRDGQVLFGKGYGYSDIEKKRAVSVNDTLFRPGSVSKLFVWTAVMQLVEQGKLDLDRDVNNYLDFRIRATFPEPVTLRRIMTHTAGFEEVVKDLFISDSKHLTSLHDYLVDHQPERIFAPGTIPAYSNYATALAGYIVQRASGEKFEDYIANHIHKPLGMVHTTFVQPLPPSLEPLMSKGYMRASGGAKAYEVVQAVPAGSVATSGADMARFAIAHLQDGRFGEVQILKPETARLMHARAFAPDPKLLAMCLGFFEETRNGHPIIGHGGDTQYFHSHIHLILDSNVGMFMSVNSAGKGEVDLRDMLWQKFLDRYFPYQPPATPTLSTAVADAAQVAGAYITSRRAESSLLRLLGFLNTPNVTAHPDGTISSKALKAFNGTPKHWREIGPHLYQEVDGQERMLFRPDAKGRMTIFSDFAALALQRVGLTETDNFNQFLLLGILVVFVLTLIFWPVAGLVRRHYKRPLAMDARACRLRRWTRLVCAWNVALMAAWIFFFVHNSTEIGSLNSGLDPWIYLLESLSIIGGIGSIVALVNAFRSILGSRWWWSKVHDVLIALACLGFVWIGFAWRLFHISSQF